MATPFNTAELLFLKALVEDRVADLDGTLEKLGRDRRSFGEIYQTDTPTTDEELSVLIVRQCHANILRKIDLELDVPWPVTS